MSRYVFADVRCASVPRGMYGYDVAIRRKIEYTVSIYVITLWKNIAVTHA